MQLLININNNTNSSLIKRLSTKIIRVLVAWLDVTRSSMIENNTAQLFGLAKVPYTLINI
jgi:hypothetical protein